MSAARLVSRREAVLGAFYSGISAFHANRCVGAGHASTASALTEVASGIFVRRGVDEDATRGNDDGIANIGFVIGREAVAVIDPGGSILDGQRLRAGIRNVTALPIRHVVFTHAHPDHIFGAGAFQQDQARFVAHHRLPQALAARGEYYRKRLDEILGPGRAGPIAPPTQLVQARTQIDLGGKSLQLTAHATAHSDCDLSVLEMETGTLFAGDLLFVQRIPSLDGSLKGWISELNSLKAVGARRAVPGHGPTSVNWPAGARDLERYLDVLTRETRRAIAAGVDIDTAVKTVGQSERAHWKLFDSYQGHNVTQAFKELEWE